MNRCRGHCNTRLLVELDDGTALEVKVRGSAASVVRQILKYFEDPAVASGIIVTTRPLTLPLTSFTDTLGNTRQVHLVELWRNAF